MELTIYNNPLFIPSKKHPPDLPRDAFYMQTNYNQFSV